MNEKQPIQHRRAGLRWLLGVLIVLVLPGLLFVGVLGWLGASEEGTRFIARQASQYFPELQIEIEQGTLSRGLVIRMVRWKEKTRHFEARNVSLSWKLACLPSGRLCLERLGIHNVLVELNAPATSRPTELATIELPFPLLIDTLSLDELTIRSTPGQGLRLTAVTGRNVALRGSRLRARDLQFAYDERLFQLGGRLALKGNYALDLTLTVPAHDQIPRIVARLEGTVRNLRYRVDGIAGLPLVLSGNIQPLQDGMPLQASLSNTTAFDYALGDQSLRILKLNSRWLGDSQELHLDFETALELDGLRGSQSLELAATLHPADLAIVVQELRAVVQAYPLELQGELAYSAEHGLQARQAVIAQGASRFGLDGSLDGGGLSWSLQVPDLQAYLGELTGLLSANGQLQKAAQGFTWTGSVLATNPAYQSQGLSQLELECSWQGQALETSIPLHCSRLALAHEALGGMPALNWAAAEELSLHLDMEQPALSLGPMCLVNLEEPARRVCNSTPLHITDRGLSAASFSGHKLPLEWLEKLWHPAPVLAGSWDMQLQWPGPGAEFAHWEFSIAELGELKGSLGRPGGRWQGNASSEGLRLTFLLPLVPDLRKLGGRVGGNVEFRVAEEGLLLDGHVSVVDGRLGLFDVDALVEGIRLDARFNGRSASLEGALYMEEEFLSLSGSVDWATPAWSAEVHLQADEIQIEPLAGMVATVTSDLRFTMNAESASLRGEIFVPRAHLDASQISPGENVIELSPDTEIVGLESSGIAGPTLDLDVALRLGDEVYFRGYGLFGDLRGGVQLQKNGARPLQANGTIVLANGYFRAYGQDLLVDEGRLVFSGSPYNPDLRLRAYRRHTVGDAEVGIIADGPVEEPRLRLYSSVAMSEEERMHYLLTGRYLEAGPETGDQAATEAAVALGLMSANAAVGGYAEQLGIEGFSMGTEYGEQGQAAQVSGYFGPRLYVKYGHSLFEPGAVFSARYQLTDRLYVEGFQGSQSALELLWFVRRRQNDELLPVAEETPSE